ncbi:MAG: acyl-CoA dehydrogenase family protein [Acidimicrobiales bacterium]
MDLDLTPEQEMLRDAVRRLCARHCDLSVVRALEDDAVGYPAELWSQFTSMGLLGMTVPEEHGGGGMTMLDAAVVYIELGRALVPSPHFASSVLAAGVLDRCGAPGVDKLTSGAEIVVPAWLEPGGGYGPAGVTLTATPRGDGYELSGTKRHVPFASSASRLLVLARIAPGPDGVLYALVDPAAPGVTLTQQMTIASDTQYRVDFDTVTVGPGDVVGTGWDTWDRVMHDGIILLAAQAVGGARHALEITTQYAKDRRQFDKPLGAFQALAHYLADAATAVDGAETLVMEAAWAASEGRDIRRLAPMAKSFACRTFRDVTAMAQQIYGGVGFTLDYDIQLYFRRAKQLELSYWDTRYLDELIAATVLDRAGV